jgi:hypothetical protein
LSYSRDWVYYRVHLVHYLFLVCVKVIRVIGRFFVILLIVIIVFVCFDMAEHSKLLDREVLIARVVVTVAFLFAQVGVRNELTFACDIIM